MTDNITKDWLWKAGQSGNPKGRPSRSNALTEVLKLKGEKSMVIGGEEISAKDALAQAVWSLLLNGEIWLSGRRLEVESVTEWANIAKWLYTHMEPKGKEPEGEQEMVVRVVRLDKIPSASPLAGYIQEDESGEEIIETLSGDVVLDEGGAGEAD